MRATPFSRRPGEPPNRLAVIDVGTNTVLCTVLFAEQKQACALRIAEELHFVTGLGRDRGPDGSLSARGQERAVRALRHIAGRLVLMGIATSSVRGAATAACREAPNGGALLRRVQDELGLPIEVIDGRREAALVTLAQRRSFPQHQALIALDIGGGSTEVTLSGTDGDWSVSIPFGATKLQEALPPSPPLAQARALVRARLAEAELGEVPGDACLIGVSGTVTTAAQALDALELWDPSLLHGRTLAREDVDALAARLLALSAAERAALPGVHPGRAEAIGPALVWLSELMGRLGREELVVSDRGMRFGLLFESWPRAVVRSAGEPR